MTHRYPSKLMWVDIETDGLPVGGDFSNVHLLEIAVVVTDFNLNPLGGLEEVIKMTPEAAAVLRSNKFVVEMHTKSGLLSECIHGATKSMPEVEQDVIDLLQEFGEPEDYMIAGSGVAAFDHPFIKSHMPYLNAWLAYYPADVGVLRRLSRILAGKEIVSRTSSSYGSEKLHRAKADVMGHIEEAKKYQEFFREALN